MGSRADTGDEAFPSNTGYDPAGLTPRGISYDSCHSNHSVCQGKSVLRSFASSRNLRADGYRGDNMVNRRDTLRDGIVVGFIGYAAVALFYSMFDLLASRGSFYTVNLLGKAVFRGLRDPAVLMFPLEPDWYAIYWYNLVHLVAALAIGIVVTSLVAAADNNPRRRGIVRLIIILGFFVTVAIVATLTTPIRPLLPMWSVVGANVAATLLAGSYLLRRRRGLWSRLALGTA